MKDYKGQIILLALAVVGFLLWSSYRSGYEAALTDVRYGNVKVSCEVCSRGD